METWTQLSEIVRKQTGRRVVGTDGGLYVFSDVELCVPLGSVEGLLHDLCHWVVANEEERKQPNMGLSQDWTHPNYSRMVRCEELAWSLELYILGDPSPEEMLSMMTPEAAASGGGYYSTSYYEERKLMTLAETAEVVANKVTEAALAEMHLARQEVIGPLGQLRPDGSEKLRREACQRAAEAGLPIKEIQRIVRAWWLSQYEPEEPEANDLNVVRDILVRSRGGVK